MPRRQDGQTEPWEVFLKLAAAHLEYGVLHVFFDDEILNVVLVIALLVGFVNPEFAMEGPNNNLVLALVGIVVNVGNADRVVVEFLIVADLGRPPLFHLENRHILKSITIYLNNNCS